MTFDRKEEMRKFLEKSWDDFRKRGTAHMAIECEKLLTHLPSDFMELIRVTKERRDDCEQFSMNYQMFWSMLTFYVSLQDAWQRHLDQLE